MTSTVVDSELEPKLNERWKMLDPGHVRVDFESFVVWTMAVTPPFADAWPPTVGTTWRSYVYAYGGNLRLRDGVYSARPWARVDRVAGSDTIRIVTLSSKVESFSIQGVRPLLEEELRALRLEGRVCSYCWKLSQLPERSRAAEMRSFYSNWLQFNGSIMRVIEPQHRDFLGWLRTHRPDRSPSWLSKLRLLR